MLTGLAFVRVITDARTFDISVRPSRFPGTLARSAALLVVGAHWTNEF
jgi:hypothetical protein